MKKKITFTLLNCFVVFLIIFFPFKVYAASLKTTYNASYTPNFDGTARVNLNILIENLDPNTYINQYSLNFPKSFSIRALSAHNKFGVIETRTKKTANDQTVELLFSAGKEPSSVEQFELEFTQDRLFQTAGAAWEIVLPTIEDKKDKVYNITVNLPTDKKITIAKPKPSFISGNKISWENVGTKMVYAVFGDSQLYKLDFEYNLKNKVNEKVYYEVAFPPETEYQKIIVSSIQEAPDEVYIDEDGNYIGKYILKAGQGRNIKFSGFAKVSSQPDDQSLTYVRKNFDLQKKYLFSDKEYWSLGANAQRSEIANLKTPREIYDFVNRQLKYDYTKMGENNRRLGASGALVTPERAVCMEYTDLFIAVAREKAIAAREIEGYGFSSDEYLRPMSLVSDLLHSWPEYYDTKAAMWVPVDPTWESTSGIDYFDSLDLNHIVLAIHGADSKYPLPAGMYKTNDKSKDITIVPVKKIPEPIKKIELDENVKRELVLKNKYKGEIEITNKGNYFLKNLKVRLISDSIKVNPSEVTLDMLAPLQKKRFNIEYVSANQGSDSADLEIFVDGQSFKKIEIKVIPFYKIFFKPLFLAVSLVFIGSIFLIWKVYKKNRHDA